MDRFFRVAKLADVSPGRILSVEVEGERIALYNVRGTIYATRDSCTHQSYPLSKGCLRGKYVKCALHGWEYNVTNGEYQGNTAIHVRCYAVKIEGDEVWVDPTHYNGGMSRDHPLLNVDPYQDLLEDIRPLRETSPDQTAPIVSAVCEAALSIIHSRPDGAEVLEYRDPVPPESLALWQSLRTRLPCSGDPR